MIKILSQPVSSRPFWGLGAQSDGFLYDQSNAHYQLTKEDLQLNETRLNCLKLAHARMFLNVQWVNPSLHGEALRWDEPDFLLCRDQIRRHQANGTLCNLVLFQPQRPSAGQIPVLIQTMVQMLKYLVENEGLTNIRWLTLWNEPESVFLYDSPLSQRVWRDKKFDSGLSWEIYVQANHQAAKLLKNNRLDEQIQLVVPDCVWGAPIRMQQMRLAFEAFRDLNVAFAYHNYNPEDLSYYEGDPDFAYAGLESEIADFRQLIGPQSPLLITEFNTVGHGMDHHFMGMGAAGSELNGSIESAVALTEKIVRATAAGLDGMSLWCLQDMVFCREDNYGSMPCGLWRFKWEGWHPRPSYHYYGLLLKTLVRGCKIYPVTGLPTGIVGLCVDYHKNPSLVLFNTTAESVSMGVSTQEMNWTHRTRVCPQNIPPVCDLPYSVKEEFQRPQSPQLDFQLAGEELAVLQGVCIQSLPLSSPDQSAMAGLVMQEK